MWEICFPRSDFSYKTVNYDSCVYLKSECFLSFIVDIVPTEITELGPFYLLGSEQWDSLHGIIRAMRKLLNNKNVEKFHMISVWFQYKLYYLSY
jgi:hypothetical protein